MAGNATTPPPPVPVPATVPAPSPAKSPVVKVQDHDGQAKTQDSSQESQQPRPTIQARHKSNASITSPARQHKRSPSGQPREVKETLNARTEYTSSQEDGRSHHIINQYTIGEEVGRGSYGAVHLATDQYGHEYAVKEFSKTRLRKRRQSNLLRNGPRRAGRQLSQPRTGDLGEHMDLASDLMATKGKTGPDDALYLIREEIAIMKKLHHPNLVSLIEVLDDPEEDSLYMVLEMCKKGVIMKISLDLKPGDNGQSGPSADPYTEDECRCWFRDLILGIEYLHAQGIVHRDIKPDNLLLTEDDVLKIVDFGVSEIFEKPNDMRTAKSAGSPAFLPPELCVSKHGDVSGTAADIWSMGISLYCLRYGDIPFNQDGVLEMYRSIRSDTPEFPGDEDSDFVDLMRRILDKNPESRIKMPELRAHPWVTQQGEDLLLSAEDNCAEMVEPPNNLEIQHAITRRMSHLLSVMKAISRFKALLKKSQRASPAASPLPTAETTVSRTKEDTEALKTANEQHAQELLEERKRVLALKGSKHPTHAFTYSAPASGVESRRKAPESRSHTTGERGHAKDPTQSEPLFLGIGTGGGDDFHRHGETPLDGTQIVSDSPIAVDYNVYDKAYEAEVKRIHAEHAVTQDMDEASQKAHQEAHDNGPGAGQDRTLHEKRQRSRRHGRPRMYITRLLEAKDKFREHDGIIDSDYQVDDTLDNEAAAKGDRSVAKTGSEAGHAIDDVAVTTDRAEKGSHKMDRFKNNKFAGLVSSTIKNTKARLQPGSKEGR